MSFGEPPVISGSGSGGGGGSGSGGSGDDNIPVVVDYAPVKTTLPGTYFVGGVITAKVEDPLFGDVYFYELIDVDDYSNLVPSDYTLKVNHKLDVENNTYFAIQGSYAYTFEKDAEYVVEDPFSTYVVKGKIGYSETVAEVKFKVLDSFHRYQGRYIYELEPYLASSDTVYYCASDTELDFTDADYFVDPGEKIYSMSEDVKVIYATESVTAAVLTSPTSFKSYGQAVTVDYNVDGSSYIYNQGYYYYRLIEGEDTGEYIKVAEPLDTNGKRYITTTGCAVYTLVKKEVIPDEEVATLSCVEFGGDNRISKEDGLTPTIYNNYSNEAVFIEYDEFLGCTKLDFQGCYCEEAHDVFTSEHVDVFFDQSFSLQGYSYVVMDFDIVYSNLLFGLQLRPWVTGTDGKKVNCTAGVLETSYLSTISDRYKNTEEVYNITGQAVRVTYIYQSEGSVINLQIYLDGALYYTACDIFSGVDQVYLDSIRFNEFQNEIGDIGIKDVNVNVFNIGYTGDISELFNGTRSFSNCADIKRFTAE